MGDGDRVLRRLAGVAAGDVSDMTDVDQDPFAIECLDHAVPGSGEASIDRFVAARSEVVGDVVGELDDADADIGEDADHLGVVADHRAVLKPEYHTEHAVGFRCVHVVDCANDSNDVVVHSAQMTKGPDPGERRGGVFPHADGGVNDVDTTRPDLFDDGARPVVDLEPVDDHRCTGDAHSDPPRSIS